MKLFDNLSLFHYTKKGFQKLLGYRFGWAFAARFLVTLYKARFDYRGGGGGGDTVSWTSWKEFSVKGVPELSRTSFLVVFVFIIE